MAVQDESSKQSSSSGRGPSYPFINLQEAILRISKFYAEEGKAPAPMASAVKHWGYSEKSSGGRQTVSTLLQYGLLREEGSGEQRRVSVSKLALDIMLHEQGSPEWLAAMRTAGRSPKLFAELLAKYDSTGLPSDSTLKHYLVAERDISPSSVDAVIRNLRSTIEFARLNSSEKVESDVSTKTPRPEDIIEPKPDIGDFVQWTSGGALQFDAPRKVRAIQEHDGSFWVFVDGSETGIPLEETTVESKAVKTATIPPQLTITGSELPTILGEREWLRGPLSKDIGYRLLIRGELGPREIGKLIRLLEAQKLVLTEDEIE
jgi:hypothetical protein